jgi:hypothetical protein
VAVIASPGEVGIAPGELAAVVVTTLTAAFLMVRSPRRNWRASVV